MHCVIVRKKEIEWNLLLLVNIELIRDEKPFKIC